LWQGNSFHTFEKEFDFNTIKEYDSKAFSVRMRSSKSGLNIKYLAKDLAKPIWNSFKSPRVSLEEPDVEFSFLFYKDPNKIHFCKKLYENEKEYLERMPKLRPITKPYTLKSDIARASLNLLKIKKGLVLDPFCGIGGILLEAYDLGFEIIGNDISWNDLKYMKKNFDYYYPKAKYTRTLADSSSQFLKDNSIDGIVTDIPYGKSSRKMGEDLYEDFLNTAKNYLKRNSRIIIIYANFLEFKNIALKYFNEVTEIF
jgi:tRNA (guanine10-N2)-dimethyltransferase